MPLNKIYEGTCDRCGNLVFRVPKVKLKDRICGNRIFCDTACKRLWEAKKNSKVELEVRQYDKNEWTK